MIYTMIIVYVLKKIEVSNDMLSKYCKDIADWYDIKVVDDKKLIPSLSDKVKYVVHYRNLKYYLSLGITLIKTHRILSFKQSHWLKKHVDFNTKKDKKFLMSLVKGCINC